MNIKDFVDSRYDFKPFSFEKLHDWYKIGLLRVFGDSITNSINTFEEFKNYELKSGDSIAIALNREDYTTLEFSIKDLRDNVDDIHGLSNKIIDSMEKSLGASFSKQDLMTSYKSIKGLGTKTAASIVFWKEM